MTSYHKGISQADTSVHNNIRISQLTGILAANAMTAMTSLRGVEERVGDLEWPQGRRDRMVRLQAFENTHRERRGLIREGPSHR